MNIIKVLLHLQVINSVLHICVLKLCIKISRVFVFLNVMDEGTLLFCAFRN